MALVVLGLQTYRRQGGGVQSTADRPSPTINCRLSTTKGGDDDVKRNSTLLFWLPRPGVGGAALAHRPFRQRGVCMHGRQRSFQHQQRKHQAQTSKLALPSSPPPFHRRLGVQSIYAYLRGSRLLPSSCHSSRLMRLHWRWCAWGWACLATRRDQSPCSGLPCRGGNAKSMPRQTP